MPPSRPHAASILLFLLLAAVPACSPRPGSASTNESNLPVQRDPASQTSLTTDRDTPPPAGTRKSPSASTVALGALGLGGPAGPGEAGLEVSSVVTFAGEVEIARVLAPYINDPVPLRQETIALWRSFGMRIISVPVAELEPIRAILAATPGNSRQWLGQAMTWTEAVAGPMRPRQTIAPDEERLTLGAGRLRILARAWLVPVMPVTDGLEPGQPRPERPAAALRIELMPQHQDQTDRNEFARSLRGDPTIAAVDQGQTFSRLLAQTTVDGERAFLIVPSRPTSDWSALVEGSNSLDAPEPDTNSIPPNAPPAPGVGEVARSPRDARTNGGDTDSGSPQPTSASEPDDRSAPGPPSRSVPTLGEAMLESTMPPPPTPAGSTARSGIGRTSRAIVVLIPRVPKEYPPLTP